MTEWYFQWPVILGTAIIVGAATTLTLMSLDRAAIDRELIRFTKATGLEPIILRIVEWLSRRLS